MAYSNEEIRAMLLPVGQLYKAGCLNYRGKSRAGQPYQEVCAEHLLNTGFADLICNPALMLTRKKSYDNNHSGQIDSITTREEEQLAKVLFNTFKKRGQGPLGAMLDYQVPLKDIRADDAGKVDLISYDGETLYLIELKNGKSDETLLRCMMEIITYANIIDKKKLFNDYGLKENTKLQPTVLFPAENINLGEDCSRVANGEMGKLEQLRKALGIIVCSLRWQPQPPTQGFLSELRGANAGVSRTIRYDKEKKLYSFVDASIAKILA